MLYEKATFATREIHVLHYIARSMRYYLDFMDHELGVGPELGRLHGVAEEPELLAPGGVVDVEGDAGAEGGDGELGDLVLADLRVEPMVEMARHVRPDQEGHLQVEQAHGEDASQPGVAVADEFQRALGKQRREVA